MTAAPGSSLEPDVIAGHRVDVTTGHRVECLEDDVAWEDELWLPGDDLIEGHVQKSALRPLLGICDQGGGLPSAWRCQEEGGHL